MGYPGRRLVQESQTRGDENRHEFVGFMGGKKGKETRDIREER